MASVLAVAAATAEPRDDSTTSTYSTHTPAAAPDSETDAHRKPCLHVVSEVTPNGEYDGSVPQFDKRSLTVTVKDTVVFRWSPGTTGGDTVGTELPSIMIETTSDYTRPLPHGLSSRTTSTSNRKVIGWRMARSHSSSRGDDTRTFANSYANDESAADMTERIEAPFPESSETASSAGTTMLSSPSHQYDDGGERYTEYMHTFEDPGDYHFVCTRYTRAMRVHVQVLPTPPHEQPLSSRIPRCIVFTCLVVLVACVAIVAMTLGLTRRLQAADLFVSEADAGSRLQYEAMRQIQSYITGYIFPWTLAGLLIVVLGCPGAAVAMHYRRKWRVAPTRRESPRFRGYSLRARRVAEYSVVALCALIMALVIVIWGIQLAVYTTSSLVVLSLFEQLLALVQTLITTIQDLDTVIQWAQYRLPLSVILGSEADLISWESIYSVIRRVGDDLWTGEGWGLFADSLGQGALLALPLLSFLLLQFAIVSGLMVLVAGVRRLPGLMASSTLYLIASTGFVMVACGVAWACDSLFSDVSRVLTTFTDLLLSPDAFANQMGFSAGSVVATAYGMCVGDGYLSSEHITEVVSSIVEELNKTATPDNYKTIEKITSAIVPIAAASFTMVDDYFLWITDQTSLIEGMVSRNAPELETGLLPPVAHSPQSSLPITNVTGKALEVIVVLAEAVDCTMLRDVTRSLLSVMHSRVVCLQHVLTILYVLLFVLSVIAVVATLVVAHMQRHPRRYWYHGRTQRRFRFRWSYKVHRRLWEGRAGAEDDDGALAKYFASSAQRGIAQHEQLPDTMASLTKPTVAAVPEKRQRSVYWDDARTAMMLVVGALLMLDAILLGFYGARVPRSGQQDNSDRQYSLRMTKWVASEYFLWAQFTALCFALALSSYILRQVAIIVSVVLSIIAFALLLENCFSALNDVSMCVNGRLTISADLVSRFPVRMTCPPSYIAYRLEVGIYSLVLALIALGAACVRSYGSAKNLSALCAARRRVRAAVSLQANPLREESEFISESSQSPAAPSSSAPPLPYLHAEEEQRANLQRRASVFLVSVSEDRRRRAILCWCLCIFVSLCGLALLLAVELSAIPSMNYLEALDRAKASNDRYNTLSDPQVLDPNVGCNGDPAYCDRRVDELVWLTTHNSHSSFEAEYIMANQYYSISKQLAAGVRAFMIDTWYDTKNGTLGDLAGNIFSIFVPVEVDPEKNYTVDDTYLCHGVCLFGRQPLVEGLQVFTQFLEAHAEQVLIIQIEQYISDAHVAEALELAGLAPFAWSAATIASRDADFKWPTLSELIASGRRLIVLTDSTAALPGTDGRPTWLMEQYGYIFETQWDASSVEELSCMIDHGWCSRGHSANLSALGSTDCSADGVVSGDMFDSNSSDYLLTHDQLPTAVRPKLAVLNSFLTIGVGTPYFSSLTNKGDVILPYAASCGKMWRRMPNLIAVDYWNVGSPLRQIDALNKLVTKYGLHEWADHVDELL